MFIKLTSFRTFAKFLMISAVEGVQALKSAVECDLGHRGVAFEELFLRLPYAKSVDVSRPVFGEILMQQSGKMLVRVAEYLGKRGKGKVAA